MKNGMRLRQIWILSIATMLLATMGIGAMTRLTGSGLSIVEWKPISGILPPFNEVQWNQEFQNYQQYPDFKSRPSLTLKEFKVLFWWEFVHRLVARSLLLVILIPYGLLFVLGKIEKQHHRKVFGLLIFGGIQGFLGWYMVKSGLVQVPRVSHFRLMIHFIWACLILGYLAQWLGEESQSGNLPRHSRSFVRGLSWLCLAQMALGALVAGSRAGYIYNTFPKLGDAWFPVRFFSYPDLWENFFYNQINLQFFHRLGGWILLGTSLYAFWKKIYSIFALMMAQFFLGVLTLVLMIPPPVATLHQLLGAILFFYLRYLASTLKNDGFIKTNTGIPNNDK
ncbi:COX15/CtaA family protein [Bdellovibrio bacteriovorus]|uniref:COX15/CtaA family protein n=1 Tax=Bdellovibrio TaxID=958 RepID=UPI0035A8AE3A